MELPTSDGFPGKDFFNEYAEAVLIASDAGIPIFVNKAFTNFSGFHLSDLSSSPVTSWITQADVSSLNNKPGSSISTSFPKKDGNQVKTKVSLSKITVPEKPHVLIYTFSDHSSSPAAPDLSKVSGASFITLAEASPAMIWMSDAHNMCFYLNKAWLEFTGSQREEEYGRGWLKHVHPDDLAGLIGLDKTMQRKESFSCDFRLMRHDGVYRNIFEIGTPHFDVNGGFNGYMGSCLDITEMKQAQHDLTALNKEFRRSNEELEQFAYVASHDLQEPLRMISGYVQLIEKNISRGEYDKLGEFMTFVLDGVSRTQALISDLLQLSRVNRKGKPFTKVDLNETVKIATAHLTTRIEENTALLSIPKMPVVNGDSFQLIRLFQNLVDNAIKFHTPDSKPEIKISVQDNNDHYLFGVQDNGIGIDIKFHNRIFVIFQRLHTRNEYEGTGIGLAVCKKIVERHGGEIWVKSQPGAGSTFYFTIKK
jgi:PAS domain S-box-containing protein